jgi:hypothetical protein
MDIYEFLQENKITIAKSYRQFENMLAEAPQMRRLNIDAKDLIDIAHASGGMVVLAHPSLNLIRTYDPELLVDALIDAEIDGFESVYVGEMSRYTDMINERIKEKKVKKFMVETGGSDTHNFFHGNTIGTTKDDFIYAKDFEKFIGEMERLKSARMDGQLTHRTYIHEQTPKKIKALLDMYRDEAVNVIGSNEEDKNKVVQIVTAKTSRKNKSKHKRQEKKNRSKAKRKGLSREDEGEKILTTEEEKAAYEAYIAEMEAKYGDRGKATLIDEDDGMGPQ